MAKKKAKKRYTYNRNKGHGFIVTIVKEINDKIVRVKTEVYGSIIDVKMSQLVEIE